MRNKSSGKKIRNATWQNWLGQWAELLQSGMPVLDALLLSSELQAATRQGMLLQHGLKRTLNFLNAGQGFQTAFRASFGHIPTALEVGLLCAQASGDLPTALKEQTQRWKLTTEATSQLARSLIYPGLVLVAAIACWVLLHHISKPHLPTATTTTGGLATGSSLLMGGGLLMLALGLVLKRKKAAGADPFTDWLPGRTWACSGYYHLLACELQAGLDLMQCLQHRTIPAVKLLGLLDITGPVIRRLNQMTQKTRIQLQQGIALSKALQEAGAPAFLVRQSQLAEQTGNIANCFLLASKVYELQAREAQNRLQNLLPSVALALAAVILALAYQSTLAPLYNNLAGLA